MKKTLKFKLTNCINMAMVGMFLLIASCSSSTISEEALVGSWKHPIESKIHLGEEVISSFTYEIFKLKADKTFTLGEYGKKNNAFYENKGTWKLSNNKQRIEVTYDDGEKANFDVRNYDGTSFVTTSKMGNDFKFTKE